jgi:hypothetical protein
MKTSVDINPEIWKRVRVLAALRNLSLSDALNEALQEWILERKPELEGLSEWVRRPLQLTEEEAGAAREVRDAPPREYAREHPENARRRSPKKRAKKATK